jgi:hypothetical protein
MRKIIIGIILLSIKSITLQAQTSNIYEPPLIREFNIYQSSMGNTILKTDLHYADISGSPYYKQDFAESEIISRDSIKYVNVKLRYNMYTDQMEFLKGNEVLAISNPTDFSYFIMDEDVFIYQSYLSGTSSIKRGYFQLLNFGPSVKLAKRFNLFYEPPSEPDAYASAKPAKFVRRSDIYYLQFPGSVFTEVNLNRKKILEVFPDKKQELENFISDKRLKFRSEDDLISLVDFYISLQIQ